MDQLQVHGANLKEVLEGYLRARFPLRRDLSVVELERAGFGLSHVHYFVTLTWQEAGGTVSEAMVFRVPPEMGCVPPYDIGRQYEMLNRLRTSGLSAPEALWLEEGSGILGKPFIVMKKVEGELMMTAYKREQHLQADMQRQFVDLLVRVHRMDWRAAGLSASGAPADTSDHAAKAVQRWEWVIETSQQSPHPVLVEAVSWLKKHTPPPGHMALVHGDFYVHNMCWRDGHISGLFDWELAEIGDPMFDIGYTTVLMNSARQFWNADDFKKAYAEAAGTKLNEESVFYWTLLAYFKYAAIALAGSRAGLESTEARSQFAHTQYLNFFPRQLANTENEISRMLGS